MTHHKNHHAWKREDRLRSTLLSAAALIALAASLFATLPTARAEEAVDPANPPEGFMTDMKNIRAGMELFRDQCGHCHGSRAYPGKAPRLRPDRYEPDFVFWVVKGGYGKMPSFEEHFTDEEVLKIVSFVKSTYFSH